MHAVPPVVPVLHVHGTADVVVPYDGGVTAQSVPATISGWVARDGCDAATSVVYENGTARCERNQGCDAGADVELCTIEGGAHEWPSMGDLAATEYILDFLGAHPRP